VCYRCVSCQFLNHRTLASLNRCHVHAQPVSFKAELNAATGAPRPIGPSSAAGAFARIRKGFGTSVVFASISATSRLIGGSLGWHQPAGYDCNVDSLIVLSKRVQITPFVPSRGSAKPGLLHSFRDWLRKRFPRAIVNLRFLADPHRESADAVDFDRGGQGTRRPRQTANCSNWWRGRTSALGLKRNKLK
jgi:hypothetical protein